MWHLATLASVVGLMVGLMAVVTTLSMAVPIFTGDRTRDAMMLAFICGPTLQVASVGVGTMREEAHPRTAISLYGLAIVLLAILLAIPALANLAR